MQSWQTSLDGRIALLFWSSRDRTKEILQRHLDRHFYVAAAGADAPAKRDITAVERRLGCKFPKEFIAHSTGAMGGAYVEVKEEFWPRPNAYDVGPFWTFLYALFVFGFAREAPDWMNLETQAIKFRAETGLPFVPCLKLVGDPDMYLFTPEGAIVQWQHELNDVTNFGGSFFDLFEREVEELKKRKDRKIAESAAVE